MEGGRVNIFIRLTYLGPSGDLDAPFALLADLRARLKGAGIATRELACAGADLLDLGLREALDRKQGFDRNLRDHATSAYASFHELGDIFDVGRKEMVGRIKGNMCAW